MILIKKDGLERIIMLALSIFVVITAAGFFYVNSRIQPPEITGSDDDAAFLPGEYNPEDEQIGGGSSVPEGITEADRKDDFYTFLIIALDAGVNTDSIVVASYDAENKEANMINIPRDSLVNVQRRIKKINGAFPAGVLGDGGKQGGVDQLKREIKTMIGFVPDFYMVIDMKAFARIIDAVGGVEVYVPYNMRYEDPEQDLLIELMKGTQILNGEQAVKFARYRMGGEGYRTITDYQRIENQQAVVKSLLDRLLRPANILKIPEFARIFTDNVFTDLDYGELIWFAGEFSKLSDTDALAEYVLPTTGTSGLPWYYELLDEPAILELINETVNPFVVDIRPEDLDIITEIP